MGGKKSFPRSQKIRIMKKPDPGKVRSGFPNPHPPRRIRIIHFKIPGPMNHIPAFKAAILVAAGICAAHFARLSPAWAWPVLAGLVLIRSLPGRWKARGLNQAVLVSALVVLGALRYGTATGRPVSGHVAALPDSLDCALEGFPASDPEIRPDRFTMELEPERIILKDTARPVRGRVLVRFRKSPGSRFGYGDRIRVTGRLTRPPPRRNPGGFDYRAWLERQGIRKILTVPEADGAEILAGHSGSPLLRRVIFPARRRILARIDRLYPESGRPLMRTLLAGDRTEMDADTEEAFAETGIIHILAVSGLHTGFIVLILRLLFGMCRLPKTAETLLVISGLAAFALITGARPPVVRAALMASIYLTGLLIDRGASPFNTVGAAALILLLPKPARLFDPGFLLSFTAVMGILYLYPKLDGAVRSAAPPGFLGRHPWIRGITGLLFVSLAAQAGTLPVAVSVFNRLPLLGWLFNLAAVPVAGLIVLLGFASLFFSAFSVEIGLSYAALNQALIRGLVWAVESLGRSGRFAVSVPTPSWPVILIYITALILAGEWKRKTVRKGLIFALLAWMNCAVWPAVTGREYRNLRVLHFDVGQGDAALVRLPRGKTLLIDGGPADGRFDCGARIIAPYLIREGIRRIDALVLTHPHLDHVGGLPAIMERFRVGRILIAGTEFRSAAYETFLETAERKRIPVQEVTAPDSLVLVPAVKIRILNPEPRFKGKPQNRAGAVNNQSIVLQIVYGKTVLMMMGDAEIAVEKHLMNRYTDLGAAVLKTGHHGSRTSSSPGFVKRAAPDYAVVSVGARNRHGHPAPETLDRLRSAGAEIVRTDKHGAVLFATDGNALRMKTCIRNADP